MTDEGVIVLVAVRLKSSRLPRKALADLAGKPVIHRLQENLEKAQTPKTIVWCTSTNPEDAPLEELGNKIGVEVFRGDEMDVLSRFVTVARKHNAHTVVRVTGDNPLTDPLMLDHMVRAHLANNAEYSYTDALPRGTRSEIMATSALEKCQQLAEDPSFSEYLTLMIKREDHFRVLKVDSYDEAVRRPELRLTIDTPEDYEVARSVFEAFKGTPDSLASTISWLDENPKIRDLNAHIQPREIDSSINTRLKGDT